MRIGKRKTKLMMSAGSAALAIGLTASANAGTSTTAGLVDMGGIADPVASATASLAQSNMQDLSAPVSARVTDNADGDLEFYLDLFSGADMDATGAFSLEQNSVAATALGNDARLATEITTLPEFSDDVAMSNSQLTQSNEGADGPPSFVTEADSSFMVFAQTAGATVEASAMSELGAGDSQDLGIQPKPDPTCDIMQNPNCSVPGGGSIDILPSGPGDLTLDSTALMLADNQIQTEATANIYAGETVLADGVTVDGDAVDASVTQYETEDASGVNFELVADADIAMGSSQGAMRLDSVALTQQSLVQADLEDVNDSTISVSNNSIMASSSVADAAQSIQTGEGAADIAASMAISTGQLSNATVSAATVLETGVGVDPVDVDGSTIDVTSNQIQASSAQMISDQEIALKANSIGSADTLDFNYQGGEADADGVDVDGQALIANMQQAKGAQSSALVGGALVGTTPGGDDAGVVVSDSSLSIARNQVEAVASIAQASNALDIEGNSVAGGLGVVSLQDTDNSFMAAAVDETEFGAMVNEDLDGSDLAVANNTIRAITVTQSNANSVNVDANDLVFSDTQTEAEDTISGDAAFVSANSQSIYEGQSSAFVQDATAGVSVFQDVIESEVAVDSNAIVAATYGNNAGAANASNSVIEIQATNIVGGDETNGLDVALATNAQQMGEFGVFTTMEAFIAGPGDDEVVEIFVDRDVTDSSVSTSGNAVQAQVVANQGNTVATVDAVKIDTGLQDPAAALGSPGPDPVATSADAAFAVISEAAATGLFKASLLDADRLDSSEEASGSALILTDIARTVKDSSVEANGNTLSAAIEANNETSGLMLSATDMQTTAAVLSKSVNSGSMSDVEIGQAGEAYVPRVEEKTSSFTNLTETTTETGSNTVFWSTSTTDADDYTNSSGEDIEFELAVAITDPDVISGLNSAGFTDENGDDLQTGATSIFWQDGTDLDTAYVSVTPTPGMSEGFGAGGASVPATPSSFQINKVVTADAIDAIPGTHNAGGVIVEVGEDIIGSSLAISENTVSGSAKSNVSSNALMVEATDIATGSSSLTAKAGIAASEPGMVEADYMLQNNQSTGVNMVNIDVYSSFGLETEIDDRDEIKESQIAVDGNSLKATGAYNIATNSISVSSTNSDASTVLATNQSEAMGLMRPVADSEIFAPVAVADSSVSVSGNETRALGVVNEATNAVLAEATNLTSTDISDSVDQSAKLSITGMEPASAEADNLLFAKQNAQTQIAATAYADIYNLDKFDDDLSGAATETNGIVGSTVEFVENIVTSAAIANNSSNTMSLVASADNQQSGGVLNDQSASGQLTSTTSASIGIALYGHEAGNDDSGAAVDASSVEVDGNMLMATTRANVASNALNGSARNLDGESSAVANGPSGVTAGGNFALASYQVSDGMLTATAQDSSIGVALNGAGSGFAALNNGRISVSDNWVQATATANTANNTVTVTGYDGGQTSAALSNQQFMTAMVSAVVKNARVGADTTGSVTGARVGVTGNSLAAAATGNTASSVIRRR